MSANGENALDLIKQMKKLYVAISLLLLTADKLMLNNNWKPLDGRSGNTAMTNGSNHIAYPDYWIPEDIFRFYHNEKHKHIRTYIAVIIHDRNNDTQLTEPLLTCGLLDYGSGNDITAWDFGYAHIHVNQDKFEIDGTLRHIEAAFFKRELGKKNIQKAYSLAVPLMDITDSNSLEDTIIGPLIKGIESTNASNVEEGKAGTTSTEA